MKVMLFVFVVFFSFPAVAQVAKWSDLENVAPEEIIKQFQESMESYNSRGSSRDATYDMKVRDNDKKIHVFMHVGEGILRNQVDAVKRYFNIYSKITGVDIIVHEGVYDKNVVDYKFIIHLLSVMDSLEDILKKQSKGYDFGELPKDLCTRTVVYGGDGSILEIQSYINGSLPVERAIVCIKNVFFHSFYIGDLYNYFKNNYDKELVNMSVFDFLNIRILYDQRTPFKLNEISADDPRMIEVASDAKKWACLEFKNPDC